MLSARVADLGLSQKHCKTCGYLRCDSFYETKDYWNSKKGAGIGRGSKITFGDRNGYPSPMHYELKNKTNSKMKAVVGGKMSLGRESIKYGGIFRKSETPEPGRYETSRPTSRGYTMRAKVKELQPSYQNAPGPGACTIFIKHRQNFLNYHSVGDILVVQRDKLPVPKDKTQ